MPAVSGGLEPAANRHEGRSAAITYCAAVDNNLIDNVVVDQFVFFLCVCIKTPFKQMLYQNEQKVTNTV